MWWLPPILAGIILAAIPLFAVAENAIIDIRQTEELFYRGAVFIDNRPAETFALGHIKGAVNLPFFVVGDPANLMTRENLRQAVGEKREVVFYCSGRMRAYHAMRQAEEWGFTATTYWYKNGFEEWQAMAKPIGY
jgi:rhodanese-related sulfurtransferase